MTFQIIKKFFFIACLNTFLSGCSSNTTEDDSALAEKSHPTTKKTINNKISPRIVSAISRIDNKVTTDSTALAKTKESQIQVYIIVSSTLERDIALLVELGLEIEIINKKLKKVQAWADSNTIFALAQLDNVVAITTPSYGSPRVR